MYMVIYRMQSIKAVHKIYHILNLQRRFLSHVSVSVTCVNNRTCKHLLEDNKHRHTIFVPNVNFVTRPPRRDAEKTRLQKENQGKRMWISLGIVGVFVTLSTLWMKYWKQKQDKKMVDNRVRSFGTPAIGGDFELIDCDGKLFSNKDLLGNWALIYFGFTNCPDICPEELEKLGNVVNITNRNISKYRKKLQPIFISIDPDRDGPESIKKYLSDFHPDFIGLTGSKDQVETATRAFRVYYSKPPNADDDYIMDHTVVMYLLDDDGQFVSYFVQSSSAGEMASSITNSCRTKEAEKIKEKMEKE